MTQQTNRQILGRAVLFGLASATGAAIGGALSGKDWFLWLAWLVVVLEFVAGLIVGIRFRRGDARYIDWLESQRTETVRLMPILGIPAALFGLPLLLVVGAIAAFPPALPNWAVWSLGCGLLAWGLAGLGIVTLMAYRPPFWLLPPWVLAQDPYSPLELRTYRRSLLVGGVIELIGAGLALAAALGGAVFLRGG